MCVCAFYILMLNHLMDVFSVAILTKDLVGGANIRISGTRQ